MKNSPVNAIYGYIHDQARDDRQAAIEAPPKVWSREVLGPDYPPVSRTTSGNVPVEIGMCRQPEHTCGAYLARKEIPLISVIRDHPWEL